MDLPIWEREYHTLKIGRETFIVDVRYSNLKAIGDGSYGFVCSADDSVTGQQVAIKKVADVFQDLVDAKRILREIKLLSHFARHENVITVLDIMCIPQNTSRFRDVYIVTGLMESDMDRIISSGQPLSGQHFQYFLFQVLRGLKYIHSASVLHRDMKPSNLLVNANCDLAICDFGLARGVEPEENKEQLTEYVVTRWYRAPELLCEATNYTKAVDIWSVGCIFAEMLVRQPFFQGRTPHHQLQVIVRTLGMPSEKDMSFITHDSAREAVYQLLRDGYTPPPKLETFFPPDTDPQAIDLLRGMLLFNPDTRLTVEECLEHPYMEELHSQMEEPTCDSLFDFEFEHDYPNGDIPLHDLQVLMYREMLKFAPSDEDEVSSKMAASKLDDDDDMGAKK
uniref:Mitogen-activated protein kinase n=1 Tax=Fibrocapsa japonica TaxID=94617 RepID=A0A7S2XWA1_9STRA|mmetsp:Transcript_1480/g.2047  ORF Transcript_1480/g.2047 Transcript_1480/m.2047 type:complete len:394 (+) Transcript_1480:210-1391(+)|eukprot:CAMPEP_0113945004 /NCGR_PEP_ID=MMETSP1339-20121228/38427_1 /TAXON_ID=94617 /ORGANISM="Fibrocapsa japonica" /LENGTH=393 /DNA_ID=CAMNT_0000950391 /DNA_START=119 /DNA_END=1300 /DNA_ORIENTATION=- /assembly_acc=CAM_ASM_000762